MNQQVAEMMTAVNDAAQAINNAYLPFVQEFLTENEVSGLALSRCQVAQSALPGPLTADAFTERDPYTRPEQVVQSLAQAAEEGYFVPAADASVPAYTLTARGQAIADGVLAVTRRAGAAVEALPAAEMARLAELLGEVVGALETADSLPRTTCLRRSRHFDPGPDAPPAERIRRYLNDLLAYRDDAHLAAWGGLGVSGPAWEALGHVQGTHVFGAAAETAEALAEKLNYRGYGADDYTAHLAPLVDRGWLRLADGRYALTPDGEAVRAAAEADTDRIFYQAWPLDAAAQAELQTLLTALAAAMNPS